MEQVIFKYLDNQDFTKMETYDNIFFVNSINDERAQIRYDKDDGWCYISDKLKNEISSFFSLQFEDTMKFIGRWVENTLQMRVVDTNLGFI